MVISGEGAKEVSKIYEEYLENALDVSWTKKGVLSHMDT